MQDNTLSKREYWSENIQNSVLPRQYDLNEYNIYRFNHLFKHIFPKNLSGNILEVGCAASAWLPYFLNNFKLNPHGIDYSEVGCRLAAENLRIIFSEDFSKNIICRDIFEIEADAVPPANIVFTYGLIEHFKNTNAILEAVGKHAKDGGLIVTIVPNMSGMMGAIVKMLIPEIFETHVKIDPEELNLAHKKMGFNKLYAGYFGTFYLKVVSWEHVNFRFKKLTLLSLNYSEKIISFLLRILHIRMESKLLSPYVVYIGKKEIARN